MTIEETKKILGMLKAAFPSRYKSMTKEQAVDILDHWHYMFANTRFSDIESAVNQCIEEMEFHPTIKDIKERLKNREWMRPYADALKSLSKASVSRFAREHGITWQEAKEMLHGAV